MNLSFSLFAISAVALCATTASAYTVGPQTGALSKESPRLANMSLKASDALQAQETFAQSEIDSNDVSRIVQNLGLLIMDFED
jgi:hypothetical protein